MFGEYLYARGHQGPLSGVQGQQRLYSDEAYKTKHTIRKCISSKKILPVCTTTSFTLLGGSNFLNPCFVMHNSSWAVCHSGCWVRSNYRADVTRSMAIWQFGYSREGETEKISMHNCFGNIHLPALICAGFSG